MKTTAASLFVALAVLLGGACGGESDPEEAATALTENGTTSGAEPPTGTTPTATGAGEITIDLAEQNDSGQTGSATLRASGDESFDVLIEMSPPAKFPGDSQNAHIHEVSCAEYAAMKGFTERLETVVDWLSNLAKGRSTTTVRQPLSERADGTFSINVHEQNAPYTVVACGDIPKR
jgi:hypothetical protein